MSEQDSTGKKLKRDVGEQLRDAVQPQVEQVRNYMGENLEVRTHINVVQLITAVAVVGILINNRRSFKFTKMVIKNHDKGMVAMQNLIKELKENGQTFTYYPGVGVWVD